MAPQKRRFTQASINQNKVLQNTAVHWEDKIWSYHTYTIQTSKKQVQSVHLRNWQWFLSDWNDKGTSFTLGTQVPDVDRYNRTTQGRAPNEYPSIPIFPELVLSSSSSSKEEEPIDKQIWQSLINLSTTVQMISTTPHPFEVDNSNMSITTAIMTQIQFNTPAGGAGPSGGGPLGTGGGPPGGGGGVPGGSRQGGEGNAQPATQQEGKPMGALLTIFEGDCSKAKRFIREFSTYLLVNHDVPALASFIQRIAITLTCIKGLEVNWWTEQQLDWLMALQPADDNLTTCQQFIQNFCNCFMDSQKVQRARIELQGLKMSWPEIDEYISKFKSIAHEAGYNPADQNTMQQFLQGLPQSIGQKVLKDMTIETYEQMKWKAISIIVSQCIINALYRWPQRNTQHSAFQNTWQARGQHPQNTPNPQLHWQGFRHAPFNSTTTPKSWNNQPVPMDLDRTQAP